jgi:hypothetical protein
VACSGPTCVHTHPVFGQPTCIRWLLKWQSRVYLETIEEAVILFPVRFLFPRFFLFLSSLRHKKF